MDWTKEAVEARKNYIGGSDAAAILGISRYKTPLQVWAIKTGQVIPPNIDDVVAVKLGNKLEQAVAEFFMDATGKKVTVVTPQFCDKNKIPYIPFPGDPNKVTIIHPRYSCIGANTDRRVIEECAGFEAKTTNQFKASEWEEDQIPAEYSIQCMHYMVTTGWPVWYLACLIGNMQFVWKVFVRSDYINKIDLSGVPKAHINIVESKTLDDMIAKEVYFWNTFIVPKEMPMQITSEDSSILYTLFPQAAPESIIELGDDVSKICENLDSMQADYKILEKEIEQQKNELKARLKTFEVGMTPKYKIVWRNQTERRIDTKLLKQEEPAIYEKYAKPKDKRVLDLSVRR